MSGIVEAVRGEGRTGRVGLVSILKDLIRDSESGIGAAPFALKGEEPPPPRLRRMVALCVRMFNRCFPSYRPTHIPRPVGRCAVGPARRKARSASRMGGREVLSILSFRFPKFGWWDRYEGRGTAQISYRSPSVVGGTLDRYRIRGWSKNIDERIFVWGRQCRARRSCDVSAADVLSQAMALSSRPAASSVPCI